MMKSINLLNTESIRVSDDFRASTLTEAISDQSELNSPVQKGE